MKYVLAAIVVAALCWIGIHKFNQASRPVEVAVSSPAASSPPASSSVIVKAAPTPPPPSLPTIPPPAPSPATSKTSLAISAAAPAVPERPWQIQPSVVEPTKPASPAARLPQITLSEVLGPNNLYHDDAFGVSAHYPQDWTVRGANRWGTNNSENTISLVPSTPTTARPSMYYQMYPNGYPDIEGTEAYFRRVAQNKENQRIAGGVTDYKNVPSSFEFTQIDGNPSVSYFGVFSRGEEVQTEFFIRILGKKGYVMFFVPGRMEDVQAIMPQIKQMAATVKVP